MDQILNPPGQFRTADRSVEDLKKAIRHEHIEAENHGDMAMYHYRQVGIMLEEVKEKLPHGEFMQWVKENCEFSYQQASCYRRLARDWDRIQNESAPAISTLRAAMRVIANDEEEEEAKPSARKPAKKATKKAKDESEETASEDDQYYTEKRFSLWIKRAIAQVEAAGQAFRQDDSPEFLAFRRQLIEFRTDFTKWVKGLAQQGTMFS